MRRNETVEIAWDTSKLVNGHTLILGMSGAGKTHMLKRMVAELQSQSRKARFHVFDVHGDINIDGASTVMFSEQTSYGLNPLRVNPDPHFGGVRKCIQNFMRTVSKATGNLGVKQEAVIRNILTDVYRMKGFHADRPDTWLIDEEHAVLMSDGSDNRLYVDVPISEKDQAKAFGARWDGERRAWWVATEHYKGGITRWPPKTVGRAYPTLDDVLMYANRLLKLSFMGSDQDAITALEIFSKHAGAFQRKELEAHKNGQKLDDERTSEALDKAKGKAIESYVRYVEAIRTGHEFDDLIKYDSTDVLKSVVDRLEGLKATGLFKGTHPPFDKNNPVWTYKLNALSKPETKLFVMFRLQELFAQALQRGETQEVLDVFVLDEVHRYADEDEEAILPTLSREARKFGVALLTANQNSELPDGFISSLGTKMVLGIDELGWKHAESKMRIESRLLEWIKLQRTAAVQFKEKGATRNDWKWVILGS